MKKFTKFMAAFLCTAVVGTTAAACNFNDGRTVLTIWSCPPLLGNYESTLTIAPDHRDALVSKYVIETFQERHPDVRLDIKDQGWGDSLNENIVRLTGAEQYPDIVGTEVYTQAWIDMGYLAPIDLPDDMKADLLPSPLVGNTVGDDVYAVPVMTNTFDFIYNENILKEAGCPTQLNMETAEREVIPPATIRELLYCVNLVEEYFDKEHGPRTSNGTSTRDEYGAFNILNQQGVGGGFRALQYLRMAGGDFVKEESVGKLIGPEDVDLNTDAAKNAFTLMRTLEEVSPFGTASETTQSAITNALLNSKVAMTIEHPTFILDAPASADLRTAPMPVFSGEKDANGMYDMTPFKYDKDRDTAAKQPIGNVMVGNICYAIPAKAKQPELALDFIKLMLEPETQEVVMHYEARFPTTKTALEAVAESDDPVVQANISMAQYSYQMLMDTYREEDPVVINGGLPCWSKNQYDIWTAYKSFTRDLYDYTGSINLSELLSGLNETIKGSLA